MHGRVQYINVLVAQWLEHRSYEIFEDSRGSAVRTRTRALHYYNVYLFDYDFTFKHLIKGNNKFNVYILSK